MPPGRARGVARAVLLADSIAAAVIVFAVIPGVVWVAAMTSPAGSRIATVPPRVAGSGSACWYAEP